MDTDPVVSKPNDTSEISANPPYSESLENALAHAILNPPVNAGIEPFDHGVNVEAVDIAKEDLPLALDHASRIYRSRIPCILLTHPLGSYLGGAGPSPDSSETQSALQQFLAKHNVTSTSQFHNLVNKEIEIKIEEIRSAAQARKEAMEKNAQIDREIEQLTAQSEMEVRVMRRKREEAERRREEKQEKKRLKESKLKAREQRVKDEMDVDKGDDASKRQKVSHP